MMKKLPSNIEINKYGLYARLVDVEDSEYIVKLRTDEKLSRFIHATDVDVAKQIEWIRNYKKREQEGKDYYFIFYKNGEPIGVNRIYNINEANFSTGSWVFGPNAPYGAAFLAQIIVRDLAFYDLELEYEEDPSGVYVDNVNVYKYNMIAGLKVLGHTFDEKGENLILGLSKEDYEKGKSRILRMIGVKPE